MGGNKDHGCGCGGLLILPDAVIEMDNRFYNVDKKKKIGDYAMVDGTGSTNYDLGLYYISRMIYEILETFYYSKKNELKFQPEKFGEIKRENYEPRFIEKIIDVFVYVSLSKLIETRKTSWSFYQLLKTQGTLTGLMKLKSRTIWINSRVK